MEKEEVTNDNHPNACHNSYITNDEAEPPVVGVVAYALPPHKVPTFMHQSLADHARRRGVLLVAIDPTEPLHAQYSDSPFDCILHKIYDPEWVRQLVDFRSTHPSVVVVDDPASIARLQNRVSMLEVVGHLPPPPVGFQIGTPPQRVVHDDDDITAGEVGLEFPVIAKPLESNGTLDSHRLSLILTPNGLNQLNPKRTPLVLQEFINHGGVLFKVYVAGDHVRCVKRPSLLDVDPSQSGSQIAGSVPFSQISNLPSSPRLLREVEFPPSDFVHHVARAIRLELGLRLFNFDMIRDTRGSETDPSFLIIDINYFPGYVKVPGFESMMTDFFLDLLQPSNLSRD